MPESSEHGWDEAMNSLEGRIDRRVRAWAGGRPSGFHGFCYFILWVFQGILWNGVLYIEQLYVRHKVNH